MGKTDRNKEEEERLKKELKDVFKTIINNNNNNNNDVTDHAIHLLKSLQRSHNSISSISSSSSSSSSFNNNNNNNNNKLVVVVIPEEYRCPISKHIISDPVILSSGITYDRLFIQKWLNEGNQTCPETKQVLAHTILTPNHLVRKMIQRWCNDHNINLPIQNPDETTLVSDRDHLISLLGKMKCSLSDKKTAAKQLRLLTKRHPSFRALFTESSNLIAQLLNPLSPESDCGDLDLREDLITTVLNISIYDENKKQIGEDPLVISVLIESLKSGNIEARSSASAALFTLSALDSNKSIIGKSGAIEPLIELLDEGHPLAMIDAASAIFNLCVLSENRGRAVKNGAVKVILKKIQDRILVDELLAILALISGHQQAIEDMEKLGAMACLFSILKESNCERNKENCIAVIYTMCVGDRSKLWKVWEEENVDGTISKLAKSGTSRAKRKANGLLERLNKTSLYKHSV